MVKDGRHDMRKYIVGAIAGFFLATAISAHAEVALMIGKVIDGQFPVKVNGVQLQNQAIVVEGTSYLPVREFGESLGMDVGFDANLGVSLTQKSSPTPVEAPEQKAQRENSEKYQVLKAQSDALTKQAAELQVILEPYERYRDVDGHPYIKPKDDDYTQAKAKFDDIVQIVQDIEKQMAELRK